MFKSLKLRGLLAAAAMLFALPALAVPTYSTTLKVARMNAVITAIDAGGAAGKLEIGTTGMATVLCTITLNYNPAATVSGTSITLAGFPKTCTAGASGVAAAARIRTSANVDVITGLTVATSGADLIVDNTSINASQTFTVSTYSFNHAALKYDRVLAGRSWFEEWRADSLLAA